MIKRPLLSVTILLASYTIFLANRQQNKIQDQEDEQKKLQEKIQLLYSQANAAKIESKSREEAHHVKTTVARAETALINIVWQCYANGSWNNYDATICLKLEISFQSGISSTKFDFQHTSSSSIFSYRVDMNLDGTINFWKKVLKIMEFNTRFRNLISNGRGVQNL